jgi:putative ABC transport system permease protein
MGVLWKIAYRNLREHKTKTLIIGSIVAVGMMVLVAGNSLLDAVEEGIKNNYTENFTGDIMIAPNANEAPAIVAGGPSAFSGDPTPTFEDYPGLMEFLDTESAIESSVSKITGFSQIQFGEAGTGFGQLFAVDPSAYTDMFPGNLEIIDGRFLEGDEKGIVLSEEVASSLADSAGRELKAGDSVILTANNAVSGIKIRELTVVGIHEFTNAGVGLDFFCFIDQTTMRILVGLTQFTDIEVDLSVDEQAVLGDVSEDDLFGGSLGGDLFGGDVSETDVFSTEDSFFDILGDTSGRDLLNEIDPNAWHYVLLKVNDGVNVNRYIAGLNQRLADAGVTATAYDWTTGAGNVAQLIFVVRTIFNGLIFVVAVVAVIIIMNTLVISVTERFAEIGTMRAIGAEQGFVRKMITMETLMISGSFGLLGIVVGVIGVGITNLIGIEATNLFLEVLFGGPIFKPGISPGAIGMSLVVVSLVGVIASMYPVSVALKITPVKAMAQH